MLIGAVMIAVCVVILKAMGEKTKDKFSLIDGLFQTP
jgi:hypothetical protein